MDSRPARHALALSVILALPLSTPAIAAEDQGLRTIRLQHVPAASAQALLRGVLDVRRIALDETRGTLTIADSTAVVERAEAILREMDVAPPIWTAELLVTQGGRARALRTLRLQDGESAELTFGSHLATQAMLAVRLKAERVVEKEAELAYSVSCRGGVDARAPLDFSEEGREVLRANDELPLAAPELRAHREELARLLGVEQPVETLVLRLSRD